ncbi:hypothetical protein JAAARDRAFT_425004 [Jaapia argillacea MUCL 33604]|uniref:Uncharacterized protein n=1 Tax=Jaapia argillacea MUCL 33604 TaxID=933084 RepID=A0A067PF08_9AGAM|nr:hypothetical protein JAAARDRAFT_425004 [Jaapia argillacea MUCL 33604]
MSSTPTQSGDDTWSERETGRNQRQLVDSCFEEGHYESGIILLDQLRSPKYKPSPAHIRQMLYISLYPPPPAQDKGKEKASQAEFGTPSKFAISAKQKKSPLIPTPAATEAAQRVLSTYALTNSPSSLFRALPSYPLDSNNASGSTPVPGARLGDEDEDDSFIAREAASIQGCKTCWAIVKEGFVKRKEGDIVVENKPKARGKKRQPLYEEAAMSEAESTEIPSPVGPYAWSTLEWLVSLFEKDERASAKNGQLQYSPLLLAQIPPPRTGSGPRWEVEGPLDIVLCCLQQPEPRRRSLGVRLITLLVNLTSTVYLDTNLFINLIFSRLYVHADIFTILLTSLPNTVPIMTFKIALCRRCLGTTSVDPVASRPKPQARPRPAVRRRATGQSLDVNSLSRTASSETLASVPSPPNINPTSKNVLPPASEILRLISSPSKSSLDLQMKFELVMAYGLLYNDAAVGDKDEDWTAMLRDGRLKNGLDVAFDVPRGMASKDQTTAAEGMKGLLVGLMGTW